jgi:hypothetical protein
MLACPIPAATPASLDRGAILTATRRAIRSGELATRPQARQEA